MFGLWGNKKTLVHRLTERDIKLPEENLVNEFLQEIRQKIEKDNDCHWLVAKLQNRPVTSNAVVAFKAIWIIHKVSRQNIVDPFMGSSLHPLLCRIVKAWNLSSNNRTVLSPPEEDEKELYHSIVEYGHFIACRIHSIATLQHIIDATWRVKESVLPLSEEFLENTLEKLSCGLSLLLLAFTRLLQRRVSMFFSLQVLGLVECLEEGPLLLSSVIEILRWKLKQSSNNRKHPGSHQNHRNQRQRTMQRYTPLIFGFLAHYSDLLECAQLLSTHYPRFSFRLPNAKESFRIVSERIAILFNRSTQPMSGFFSTLPPEATTLSAADRFYPEKSYLKSVDGDKRYGEGKYRPLHPSPSMLLKRTDKIGYDNQFPSFSNETWNDNTANSREEKKVINDEIEKPKQHCTQSKKSQELQQRQVECVSAVVSSSKRRSTPTSQSSRKVRSRSTLWRGGRSILSVIKGQKKSHYSLSKAATRRRAIDNKMFGNEITAVSPGGSTTLEHYSNNRTGEVALENGFLCQPSPSTNLSLTDHNPCNFSSIPCTAKNHTSRIQHQCEHPWSSHQSFLPSSPPLTVIPLPKPTPILTCAYQPHNFPKPSNSDQVTEVNNPFKDKRTSTPPLKASSLSNSFTLSQLTPQLMQIPLPKTTFSLFSHAPLEVSSPSRTHRCYSNVLAEPNTQTERNHLLNNQPPRPISTYHVCEHGDSVQPIVLRSHSVPVNHGRSNILTKHFSEHQSEEIFERRGGPEDWPETQQHFKDRHFRNYLNKNNKALSSPVSVGYEKKRRSSRSTKILRQRSSGLRKSRSLHKRHNQDISIAKSLVPQNQSDRPLAHLCHIRPQQQNYNNELRFPVPPNHNHSFCHLRDDLSDTNLHQNAMATFGGSTYQPAEPLCGVPKIIKDLAQNIGQAVLPQRTVLKENIQSTPQLSSAVSRLVRSRISVATSENQNEAWIDVTKVPKAVAENSISTQSTHNGFKSSNEKMKSKFPKTGAERCYQATVIPSSYFDEKSKYWSSPISKMHYQVDMKPNGGKYRKHGIPNQYNDGRQSESKVQSTTKCVQAAPIVGHVPSSSANIRIFGVTEPLGGCTRHSTSQQISQNYINCRPLHVSRLTQSIPIHASTLDTSSQRSQSISNTTITPNRCWTKCPQSSGARNVVAVQSQAVAQGKPVEFVRANALSPVIDRVRGAPSPINRGVPPGLEIDLREVQIGRLIGKGATSQVFKGTWRGSEVAIKKLLTEPHELKTANGKTKIVAYKDFYRELGIIVRLRHPNLVLFMGTTTRSKPLCVVTEYCAGGNLFRLLHGKAKTGGFQHHKFQLSWNQKFKLCLDVARAGFYLHASNPPIIHRDLKSLNVLLAEKIHTPEDVPLAKVSDFGLSRVKRHPSDWGLLTGMAGTYHWMAPEVLQNEHYTEKVRTGAKFNCPLYQVVYEILSQTIPYDDPTRGTSPICIAMSVAKGRRPDITKIPEGCPKQLIDLMASCWDADPNRRPSFGQIVNILSQLYCH